MGYPPIIHGFIWIFHKPTSDIGVKGVPPWPSGNQKSSPSHSLHPGGSQAFEARAGQGRAEGRHGPGRRAAGAAGAVARRRHGGRGRGALVEAAAPRGAQVTAVGDRVNLQWPCSCGPSNSDFYGFIGIYIYMYVYIILIIYIIYYYINI